METIAFRRALIACFVSAATAASAGNMSLELEGLPAVQLSAFDTGASNASTFLSGGGSATGKATFKDFTFRSTQSAATPGLMRYVADGRIIRSARIQVRSTDGVRLLSEWTLTGVLVSSLSIVNGELDVKAKAADSYLTPETTFSLGFSKVCYKVFAADGTAVAAEMCFDLAANKAV
jgi:type VI protein secretion system component Hcp